MFDRSSQSRHKNPMRVRLAVTGSEPFEAVVFLKLDERLIDLLNDPRAFIPVRRTDGATMIVAKANIVSVTEIPEKADAGAEPIAGDDEEAAERRQFRSPDETDTGQARNERRPRPRRIDPYEVLRVARDAPIEEIKRAYKARIKAVHPDAIAALDLDEDLARAANNSTQRVNQAYDMIMRDRQQADGKAAGAGAVADQA